MDDEIIAAICDRNTRGVLLLGPPKRRRDTNPEWTTWIGGNTAGRTVLIVRYDRDRKSYTKEWRPG